MPEIMLQFSLNKISLLITAGAKAFFCAVIIDAEKENHFHVPVP